MGRQVTTTVDSTVVSDTSAPPSSRPTTTRPETSSYTPHSSGKEPGDGSLPDAVVVMDPFHVIQLAGEGLTPIRVSGSFARNVTQRLGSARSKPVNAVIATIFAQTTPEAVVACYHQVTDSLKTTFPDIAGMLKNAEPDLTAFAAMPREHWHKI